MAARLAQLAAAGMLLAAALVPGLAGAAKNDTRFASLPTGTDGSANNANSDTAEISNDGRYVAFLSTSDNLVANDNNSIRNLFVRDLLTATTTLASLPTGADGTGNGGAASNPSISGDGRYVAFDSGSDNLAGNDNDSFTNVYVRDMVAETTTLASLPTGTDGSGNNASASDASISADGRYVSFTSTSDNLATNDNNAEINVYVRDLVAQTTTLASLPTGIDGAANNDPSSSAVISDDGYHVAFESSSTNLATNDNDTLTNIYVRDLLAQTTTLVSLPTGTSGLGNNDTSEFASISRDGNRVLWQSRSDNLATNDDDTRENLYVRDVQAQTTTLAGLASGTNGVNPDDSINGDISPDGRYVAFESGSDTFATNDNDADLNAYIRDLSSLTTTLVSLPTGTSGSGNNNGGGAEHAPSVSEDGRYVAFQSQSDNLSATDNNAFSNIFVRTPMVDRPRNEQAPRVTGQAVVGQQLSCADGLWTDGTTTRQWRRNEQAIGGQTGSTYTLAGADAGQVIDCLVTATNADGTADARSNAVLPVQPGQGPAGPQGTQGPQGPGGAQGQPAIRLLVGLISDRVRSRSGRRARFRYLATAPGQATLQILRGRRVAARVSGRARTGRNSLRTKRLRAGRYRIRLTLRGADGQTDADSGRLTVRRR